MKKRVIWLTGSMSSGKSTQRRNLSLHFGNGKPIEEKGTDKDINYHFTTFGKQISVIGKVKQLQNEETSSCDGLDSVFGTVKKVGGLYSVNKALEKTKIVILEGSQTSPSWIDLLQPTLKKHNADLFVVHLQLSYWDNFVRLIGRQYDKEKLEKSDGVDFGFYNRLKKGVSDKNIESLIGKNRQFNNCYEKAVVAKEFCKTISINAAKSKDEVFEEIIEFVFSDLF